MDTAHWPQDDIMVKAMEDEMVRADDRICGKAASLERKVRAQKEQGLNCPRCNSSNTKFCYYNNYSLSQPRYFCKTCRRYWTEGGSLRNIPVGGGSRKNKIIRSSSNSSTLPPNINLIPQQNPKNQDLNLGHDHFKTINELIQVPNYETTNPTSNSSSASPHHHHHLSAMELLTGITSTAAASRSLNSNFLPMPNIANSSTHHDPNNTSGFSLPCLNFSLDGLGTSHFGSFQGVQQTNGDKLLFPLNKQLSNTTNDGDSNGYWNGVLGGGGSWHDSSDEAYLI